MTNNPKSVHISASVHEYLVTHGSPPDEIQAALIDETQRLGDISVMQIAPEQGAFMTLFARAIGAKRAIEIGTFTGYSALCVARGLPEDGQLICCDVSEEWTSIARRYWEKAGVSDRIELRLGPAIETLRALPEGESFDLAFIDADKGGYIDYYEEILARLRPGGLILADNTLWLGRVADPENDDESTRSIRAFNDRVTQDPRVDNVLLNISDGLMLARKRD